MEREFTHATVHVGPKGGVEYRLWTIRDTFLVVGKYKARPYLSDSEREKADNMEADRKAQRARKAENDRAWSAIMRGRSW